MDPVALLSTVAILGVIVKGAVDALRRKYPTLDGGLIQLIAVVVGIGLAAALDLRATIAVLESIGGVGNEPHFIVDWILTGVTIGFGAGALAELVGRSGQQPAAIVEVDSSGNRL